ncbi:MAG: helix-turn-helix domain-containing protein [Gammaproteobacteria bacterium]|nr:helix-turn-helix domain-containing protein [Gammaproteobacteria bacterium]
MPALSIGARLIAAREHSKLTLEKISENTKMPLKKLEALENDEVNVEEFTAFDKAFLKKYCQFIGVIYDDLFADLKVKSIKLDKLENKFVRPVRTTRRKKRLNLMSFVVSVCVLMVGYYSFIVLTPQYKEEITTNNHLILDAAYNQNI